jgi:hypothetical protein
MRGQPALLLSLPTGHNLANVVHSGVLDQLIRAEARPRIVALSPLAGDPEVAGELTSAGVEVEPLLAYQPNLMARTADSIASEQFLRTSRLNAVQLQRDRARLLRHRPPHRVGLLAKTAVCRLPLPRTAWLNVGQYIELRRPYRHLFDRSRPDLVLTSTAGFALSEVPLIYEAWRRGVPVAAIDLGWDNLSSKYHTILPIDRLVVWNQYMRAEAMYHHGFKDGQVTTAGAPQFDAYFNRRDLPARSAFMASIGAPSEKRLVTLATTADGTYPGVQQVVDWLARATQADRYGQPTYLLVRLHPRDRLDSYRHMQGQPNVRIEKPGTARAAVEGVGEFDAVYPSRADRTHLAATLTHSDVVINFASTITLEACIFDTPVINIGFDDQPDLPLPLSIRRYFAYEHYRPVLEAGAVRVANSPDQLVDLVREYLADPSRDREGRRAVVQSLCGSTDGKASRRVADSVIDWLSKPPTANRATMARPLVSPRLRREP